MNKPLHVVADCDIPFLQGVLEPYAQVDYLKGNQITSTHLRQADALLVRTRTRCDRTLLEGTPVRLIATATIGHDHIDQAYCDAQGIEVATAAGCNARGVLQYVIAALLLLSQKDHWKPRECTLGVVGVGNVGSLIAQYGRLFGFRVLCCDPPKQWEQPACADYCTLEEMLPQCDVVTLHVPLITQGVDCTVELADADFFDHLKPGAVFINSSRGKVISDEALLCAMDRGRVSRAVIDTWNNEPEIHAELLRRATFATPHIAGYSLQGKAAGTAAVVRALSLHYALPLDGWYPPEVRPGKADLQVTWEGVEQTMPTYFDLERQSKLLKADPARFESFRNEYDYRIEYF